MATPQQLRRDILQQRDRLDPAERSEKSSRIVARLLRHPAINAAGTVFIYVDFRSEVQTRRCIDQLLAAGKRVCVPRTLVDQKRLEIIALEDPEQELIPGYCSIPEPRDDLPASRRIPPQQLDLIILPGSVFDRRCGRFGYGGGYYDRLLAAIPAATRIGLAFELQLVERLPLAPHDELLDGLITENSSLACNREQRS